MPSRPRLVGLDLLRCLAVMLVLGRHMPVAPDTVPAPLRAMFHAWGRGGWVGVDLFFVLSGFLVSGLLFAEYKSRGRLSLLRFYTRRGWKIYPPFWVLIVATTIIGPAIDRPIEQRALFSELLFVQSYIPGIWNHTWSLAVEEHFYLLLPLALMLVLRLNGNSPSSFRPVLLVGACMAMSVLVLRILNWHYHLPFSPLLATHLRLDSLFFGVVISYLYHFHTVRFVEILTPWRFLLIISGGLLLTPAFVLQLETTPFIFTVGFTLFYLGSGMLLVGVLLCELPPNRLLVGLAALGAYSYSIYLWHMPVMGRGIVLLEQLAGTSFVFGAKVFLCLGGSIALGLIMAKLIEFPALRLRDKWFPPRSEGPIEQSNRQSHSVKDFLPGTPLT